MAKLQHPDADSHGERQRPAPMARRDSRQDGSLTADQVGEYSGHEKEIRPVTLTTYQLLTYRRGKNEEFLHFKLFAERDWGLIIYDEVHLLPAPVFRATAELQARRRLGPHGDAGPRGRRRGRRLHADRPQALRRAVEGSGAAGLDRHRPLHRDPHPADRGVASPIRGRRRARQVPHLVHQPLEARTPRRAPRRAPRRQGAGDRPVHRSARGDRRATRAHRSSPARRHRPSATCSTRSSAGRS